MPKVCAEAENPTPQIVAPEGPELSCGGLDLDRGGKQILTGISAQIRPRELTAVIGPSGSGKSSLLRCFAGILKPSGGMLSCSSAGEESYQRHLRTILGYVPQDDYLFTELRVTQSLVYSARLRSIPKAEARARVAELVDQLGLTEAADRRIRQLSGGQRKRVSIAQELIARPRVLILDEPASGLDPGAERDLIRLLRELARAGHTLALTTHSMEYLDEMDQIILLSSGRLKFAGRPEELLGSYRTDEFSQIFSLMREEAR